MIDVRVQGGDFNPGTPLEKLGMLHAAGVASFTGFLRAQPDVAEVLIEHYPALAKVELARVANEAQERWPIEGIVLIHRHGRLKPQDRVLFAGAASSDPGAAVEACQFLVAAIGERAPFWRKDVLADGTFRWR